MEKFLPILAVSPLFRGTVPQNLLPMLGCLNARTRRVVKNEVVFRAGEKTRDLGLLLSGSLLLVQEDVWGRRNIMGHVEPGGTFGETFALSADATLTANVVAQENGEIMLMDMARVIRVCPTACPRHARLVNNLVVSMAQTIRSVSEKVTHMSRRSTREKILSYLSAESQKAKSLTFTIPFNRQQLADYLCVERAAMSAELSKLQRERLLVTRKNAFELLTPVSGG